LDNDVEKTAASAAGGVAAALAESALLCHGGTAWGLDVQVWNLLWTGEEAMKKGIPILKRAGFRL